MSSKASGTSSGFSPTVAVRVEVDASDHGDPPRGVRARIRGSGSATSRPAWRTGRAGSRRRALGQPEADPDRRGHGDHGEQHPGPRGLPTADVCAPAVGRPRGRRTRRPRTAQHRLEGPGDVGGVVGRRGQAVGEGLVERLGHPGPHLPRARNRVRAPGPGEAVARRARPASGDGRVGDRRGCPCVGGAPRPGGRVGLRPGVGRVDVTAGVGSGLQRGAGRQAGHLGPAVVGERARHPGRARRAATPLARAAAEGPRHLDAEDAGLVWLDRPVAEPLDEAGRPGPTRGPPADPPSGVSTTS